MPTNQQRRDAERRRLQKQLDERRAREKARQRFTLIASIVGTLVVIAAVVVIVVVATSGSDSTKNSAQSAPTSTASSPVSSAPASSAAAAAPPVACTNLSKSATASYKGVTVGDANNIKHEPKVTSKSALTPAALECADLVVGTGKAATPSSTVSVQYTGVLYKDGTKFDSSWGKAGGQPASFSLQQVVPGFTQGIGGTGKVAPMREGGRRLMILPASLGYGAQGSGPIPANASLVFVVDLEKVS